MGIVVVTHDLGLAWNIADRIAVMYLGRVVECGTTEEVLDRAAPPLHAGAAVRRARDRAAEPVVLTGEIPDPSRIPAGCRFHPRCPQLADGTAEGGRRRACRAVPLEVLPATGRPPGRVPPRRRALDNAGRSDDPSSY